MRAVYALSGVLQVLLRPQQLRNEAPSASQPHLCQGDSVEALPTSPLTHPPQHCLACVRVPLVQVTLEALSRAVYALSGVLQLLGRPQHLKNEAPSPS